MRLAIGAAICAAAILTSLPTMAEPQWQRDAVTLYQRLMDMAQTGELKSGGLQQGTPGGAWLNSAVQLDNSSPRGAAGMIPTPFGEPVVIGDLMQLAREIVSGYRTAGGNASYSATMSRLWAGAAVCVDIPAACAAKASPETSDFLQRLKSQAQK